MRKSLFFILIAAFLTSCGSFPTSDSIKNLEGDRIIILGHGGMGSRALVPMNTRASFQDCFNLNPDGTELDVQMTKDCVLVAYHGSELFGTTECFGPIEDCDWEMIVDCNYKAWSIEKEILSLETILSEFRKPGRIFSFDLKMNTAGNDAKTLVPQRLFAIISKFPEMRFFIESTDHRFLESIHSIPPNAELFYYGNNADLAIDRALKAGLAGISINYRQITKKQIEQAHSLGHKVMVWGSNTAAGNKEAANLSPDIIQTDRLDHLISGLRDRS